VYGATTRFLTTGRNVFSLERTPQGKKSKKNKAIPVRGREGP
jgi:hypothetical protein